MTTPAESISLSSTVVAAPGQVSCDLSGEAVLLNLNSGVYYGLDPVGARIWELVQQPQAVSALRDTILEEYEVEPDRCERDLIGLLQQLAREELIEVRDAKAP